MKSYGVIYKITNKINGKAYVGQTVQSLSVRWSKHKSSHTHCRILKKAMDKYGIDNFTIESIVSAFNAEGLHELEVQMIKEFNTVTPNGYNMNTGSDCSISSPEAKANKSAALKKKYSDPAHAKKMQIIFQNPERKRKIGEAAQARWNDPNYKAKMIEKRRAKVGTC
jgi:group I intron endonuclease